ncbi:hypothetical protein L9F63_013789, partial [Diploptera punctata]
EVVIVVTLALSAGGVTFKDTSSEASETAAGASDFDGFGGFGGFRGFHQINGFMSNAFGDLEGQFDSSGFSPSQSRNFDSGYGQHFLEDIDPDTFASEVARPTQNQKKHQLKQTEPKTNFQLPGLLQYLPTSNNARPQDTTFKKSHTVAKFKQTTQPYRPQVQTRVTPKYGSVVSVPQPVYPSISSKQPYNVIPAPTNKKPANRLTNTFASKRQPQTFTI